MTMHRQPCALLLGVLCLFSTVLFAAPGDLDATFGTGGKVTTAIGSGNDSGHSMAMQSDGKILVAGHAFNGSNDDFALARFTNSGTLDTTFNGTGKVTTGIGGGSDVAYSVVVQNDGKILVAGYSSNGSNNDFALVRYTTTGNLDPSFNGTGKVITPIGVEDRGYSVAVQSDGKILVAGYSSNGSNYDMALVRYTSTGELDTSFNATGKVTAAVGIADDFGQSVTVQNDGKILVTGYSFIGNNNAITLVRFTSTGQFDTSFNGSGKVSADISADDRGHSIAVQSDGKIIVAGSSSNGIEYDLALLRYTSEGELDTGFNGTGRVITAIGSSHDHGRSVAVQSDGKIIVAGTCVISGNFDIALVRYTAEGGLDTSFNGTGKVTTAVGSTYDEGTSVAVQSDGNILVAGHTYNGTNNDMVVVRYESGTALVSSLASAQGAGGSNLGISGQVNPAGLSTTVTVQYGTSAMLGSSQSVGTFPGSGVQAFTATLYPSGLTAGTTYYYRIVAANANGTTTTATQTFVYAPGALDLTFSGDGIQTTSFSAAADGRAVALQPDGKTVVAGYANNGTRNVFAVARYGVNGDPDPGFGSGGKMTFAFDGTDERLHAITLQPDGKIVVAGASVRGGDWDFVVARLTTAGVLDTAFDTDGIAVAHFGSTNDVATGVAVQANGQIVVAGYSSNSAATAGSFFLARFNSNGAIDTGFDGDGGAGDGRFLTPVGTGGLANGAALALQNDGKILVGGDALNSNRDFALVRYTTAGLLDTGFGSGGKVTTAVGSQDDQASGIQVQSDGKIVLAGRSYVGGNYDFAAVRYLANGNLDTTFNGGGKVSIASAGDSVAYGVALQADGRIIMAGSTGGNFNSLLARLNADGSLDTTFNGTGFFQFAVGGGGYSLVNAVAVDAQGRIVAAGGGHNGSFNCFAVIRLLGLPEIPLVNGGFETTETLGGWVPTGFGDWGQDQASIVGAENGIAPYAGSRMLKFLGTGLTGAGGDNVGDVVQYFDLAPYATQLALAGGSALVSGSARFNRVAGNASTDTRMSMYLFVRSGSLTGSSTLISDGEGAVITDSDPATWQRVSPTIDIPSAGRYLGVILMAEENVTNNTVAPEFDGHYADDVTLSLSFPNFAPTFANTTSVGGTAVNPVLTGLTLGTLTLNYAPTTGAELMLVKNTGLGFITGQFSNLAQGQNVTLSYGGVNYQFVANYYGGSGNDLVLQWANTRVMAWGNNGQGQMGNNSTTNSSVPVAVSGSGVLAGKTITSVAVGEYHSVALCSDGTVAAWGFNALGQLGNNSTTDSSVPVLVHTSGALAGKKVIGVAAGTWHSMALCSDGTVAAWGGNGDGQLGNGNTSQSNAPVAVSTSGVLSGKTVVGIAAGLSHSLALCSDGTVAAWGYDISGQLGNNSTTQNSSLPVAVSTAGVLAGKTVTAVSAGGFHSLALCSDGTVAAWGRNTGGQLGNGGQFDTGVPTAVSSTGLLAGKTVIAIAGGSQYTLALCSDGTVAAWGYNVSGQLGNNSTAQSNVPVAVNADGFLAGKSVRSIRAGAHHSLALCSDGTVASWGLNGAGQLGNASTTSSLVPVQVSMSTLLTGERFAEITSGSAGSHVLALAAAPPTPVVATLGATGIAQSTATLVGTVNAATGSATVVFDYGLDMNYGGMIAAAPSPVTGNSITAVSAAVSGLTPNTTYHYRVRASSAGGTSNGADFTFTTLPDTTGPTGGILTLSPASPVDANASLSVSFSGWTDDYSLPLSYAVFIDDVIVSTQGSLASRNLTAPSAPGAHTLKGRIYDAVGNYTETSTQNFTVLTSQESWKRTHFGTTGDTGDAADGADPNGNGIKNLIEYALAGDPVGNTVGVGILPQVSQSSGSTLQLSFTRYLDRADLTLTVQASNSPTGPWTDLARSTGGGAFVLIESGATVSESGSGNSRSVTVTDLFQMYDPAHPRRFMQLEVKR